MKRSLELAPLSRDHHEALTVALRLRRANAEGVEEAVARFEMYWSAHGELHFEIEESRLLPALDQADPVWAEAVARVRAEHADLRGGPPRWSGAVRRTRPRRRASWVSGCTSTSGSRSGSSSSCWRRGSTRRTSRGWAAR